LGGNTIAKNQRLKKIAKVCHNYLQHERVIKIFLYFEYRQICLNTQMVDFSLEQQHKIEKKATEDDVEKVAIIPKV